MKVARTTTCGAHGHPEFRISYDPALVVVPADIEWLLGWLQDSVADGVRYEPGQTCQVGWGLAEVRRHESGDLCLWEPDMRSIPIEWVEGVTTTLANLRTQKDVVESLLAAEDLSFPSLRQSAIICTRLGPEGEVVLERTEPEGNDSGWFFGCQQGGHNHNDVGELRRVSVYEAAARHAPGIVPYLALPPGVLVVLRDDGLVVYRDGERLAFRAGSYLAARYPWS